MHFTNYRQAPTYTWTPFFLHPPQPTSGANHQDFRCKPPRSTEMWKHQANTQTKTKTNIKSKDETMTNKQLMKPNNKCQHASPSDLNQVTIHSKSQKQTSSTYCHYGDVGQNTINCTGKKATACHCPRQPPKSVTEFYALQPRQPGHNSYHKTKRTCPADINQATQNTYIKLRPGHN